MLLETKHVQKHALNEPPTNNTMVFTSIRNSSHNNLKTFKKQRITNDFFCGHIHCIQASLQTTRIMLPPATHAKGAGTIYLAFLAVGKLSNKVRYRVL